jgi:hypothetical protein
MSAIDIGPLSGDSDASQISSAISTSQAVDDLIVFPQDEGTGLGAAEEADFTSGGYFGGLVAQQELSNYVERGMLIENVSGGTFDITSGLAFIYVDETIQVQDLGGVYSRDWTEGITLTVQVPDTSGISYIPNQLNHVYVGTDPAVNNAGSLTVRTNDVAPPSPSLKIAEIDDR